MLITGSNLDAHRYFSHELTILISNKRFLHLCDVGQGTEKCHYNHEILFSFARDFFGNFGKGP